jgi:hypothetical protein
MVVGFIRSIDSGTAFGIPGAETVFIIPRK